jgi:hypothetical protein
VGLVVDTTSVSPVPVVDYTDSPAWARAHISLTDFGTVVPDGYTGARSRTALVNPAYLTIVGVTRIVTLVFNDPNINLGTETVTVRVSLANVQASQRRRLLQQAAPDQECVWDAFINEENQSIYYLYDTATYDPATDELVLVVTQAIIDRYSYVENGVRKMRVGAMKVCYPEAAIMVRRAAIDDRRAPSAAWYVLMLTPVMLAFCMCLVLIWYLFRQQLVRALQRNASNKKPHTNILAPKTPTSLAAVYMEAFQTRSYTPIIHRINADLLHLQNP